MSHIKISQIPTDVTFHVNIDEIWVRRADALVFGPVDPAARNVNRSPVNSSAFHFELGESKITIAQRNTFAFEMDRADCSKILYPNSMCDSR